MQQGGGSSGPPTDQLRSAEPASPIRSWQPTPAANFNTPVGHGNPMADGVVDLGESSAATGGNRWPRQETLALLKIRSEMDTAFRDAPLKAPLWDEVARKLGELGYTRSGKKCKEKFENVHKYYKRTKEGRSGRPDGKSYRFFNQLEALHGSPAGGGSASAASVAPAITLFASTAATVVAPVDAMTVTTLPVSSSGPNPQAVITPPAAATQPIALPVVTAPVAASLPQPIALPAAGIGFSSSSSSEAEDEGGEQEEGREGRKRKRGGSRRKMAAFFDGLMRQVTERQEAMQRHLLDIIEKREEERLVREEAWRQQATARLAREYELLAQERAAAGSRDAVIVAFLQKLTDQNIQLPPIATIIQASVPAPPASQPPLQPQSNQSPQTPVTNEMVRAQHQLPPPSSPLLQLAPANLQETVAGGGVIIEHSPASSRWPKVEVHALIQLRNSLETKYQEAGPKRPLWEEISSEMLKLGYNRNPKRCKEKWENINKYFKKVKESNRKRPQDAKTCPYFDQLNALYRQKLIGNTGSSSASTGHTAINQIAHHQPRNEATPNPIISNAILSSGTHTTRPPPPQVHPAEGGGSGNDNRNGGNADRTGASGGGEMMKPEGIAKEMAVKPEKSKEVMDDYNDRLEEHESDHMDDDDDYDYDDEDDDEEDNVQYKVQLQRPDASGSGGAAPATGSFLSMV